MRIVRTVGAVVVWIVATVLLVLAAVLCITIVLSPLGVLLGFAAFQLYKLGLRWALPRPADVRKTVRKEGRRWRSRAGLRPRRRSRLRWRRTSRVRRVRRALRWR